MPMPAIFSLLLGDCARSPEVMKPVKAPADAVRLIKSRRLICLY